MGDTMKFTTARRLIKEHKKGAKHSAELIQQAHAVCHEYHDKVERGKAAELEIANHVRELQAKLKDGGKEETRIIPEGMTPEEFAKRQVNAGRRGTLDRDQVHLKQGKIVDSKRYDPMGNKPAATIGANLKGRRVVQDRVANIDARLHPSDPRPNMTQVKLDNIEQ